MEQEIASLLSFQEEKISSFYPSRRRASKGCQGRGSPSGDTWGRALEIRAFITLAILLRGRKSKKKKKMKWELFMPQAASESTESKS